MSAQAHTSDAATLDRRTLARDHRRLTAFLRPGLHVLDVGCGTGAITAGIAAAVGPGGSVLGIDRDAALLAHARARHAAVPGLRFEARDVFDLELAARFDVVSAARVLQWIDRPDAALARMTAATRPGGSVVALDYSHADLAWEPAPPPATARFFDAFRAWRAANGWDNRMAHRLPELFTGAGLVEVSISVEDEIARRGDDGFDDAMSIWQTVMQTMAARMTESGFTTREAIDAATAGWNAWRGQVARQHVVLRAVAGRRPEGGRP